MNGLQELRLQNYDFTGPLPPAWVNMSALQFMNLSTNRLSGTLPPVWGDMSLMKLLTLSSNRLNSTVPAQWSAIGSAQVGVTLDLDSNCLNFSHQRSTALGAWPL
jgi:hypothetical protein